MNLHNFFNTTTSADGTYTIANIASGAFSGSITKDGYTSYNFSDTISQGQTITIDASLTPIPPIISNIAVSEITADSAMISWTTDQPSDSLVEYGETTEYGSSVSDSALTTSHNIVLTNLTASTTYHFKVTSTNSSSLSASSGDNTFITLSPPAEFTATTIGDFGNVTVMEVSGNYDAKKADGSINALPRQEIAKEFLRLHNDAYDFFIIFSNFNFLMPEADAKGFYLEVKNNTQGIGKPLFDDSASYGSNGKLQGVIDMGNISNCVTNLLAPNFDETINTIAHELMHRWGASVYFKDNGIDSSALLGKDGTHWSYLLDSDASVLYGNDWQDNGDGTFTSTGGLRYYSPLDLYLAGFYDSSQVPQMLLIDNPDIDATKLPEPGATISGAAKYVTIGDIIASEGDRIPDASVSQKNFKTAFIYITTPGTFTADALPGIENIRNTWAGKFANLTHGRGAIMDVAPSLTLEVASPSNGETIYKPYVTVRGAIINSTGNETGVIVNGMIAAVDGTRFIANNVPLTEGSNTITVTATDTAGSTATTSITVNAVTTGNYITLSATPESGIVPLEVTLKIDGSFSVEDSSINVTGPAEVEFLSSSPDEYKIKIIAEGIYYFTASVTGPDNNVYQDTIAITVINKDQLNIMLKGKWDGMKTAMISGNTELALGYLVEGSKDRYRQTFAEIGNEISDRFAEIIDFELYTTDNHVAQFGAIRIEPGGIYAYPVTFVKDENGIWKAMGF